MKALNLYAGLGGNRAKWEEVCENIEVTAVENDSELARLYQKRFPKDEVIVADAHEYLLYNYNDYDFIWSSPPCPTHSKSRFWAYGKTKPIYPDMRLYQEIIFLQYHINNNQKFAIENVDGYYDPLIKATKIGRHLFWTNFPLKSIHKKDATSKLNWESRLKPLLNYHGIEEFDYGGRQKKLTILRNMVDSEVGKNILLSAINSAINKTQSKRYDLERLYD